MPTPVLGRVPGWQLSWLVQTSGTTPLGEGRTRSLRPVMRGRMSSLKRWWCGSSPIRGRDSFPMLVSEPQASGVTDIDADPRHSRVTDSSLGQVDAMVTGDNAGHTECHQVIIFK